MRAWATPMIPIALVAGAIAGRWWIVPIVAVAWSALVFAIGACDLSCSPQAAGLAALNTAIGVALHQAFRFIGRSVQRRRHR